MKLIFQRVQPEAGDVYSFIFLPAEPLQWQAGQSIRIEIPAGYGVEERRFTVSSAPYEKEIAITTKVSKSEFKQALKNLQPGDEVDGYAIEGDFVWNDDSTQKIFVASGIGITPFHAILKQRVHERQPIPAILLYAARTDDMPFKGELDAWQAADPNFKVVYVTGKRLTSELVATHVPTMTNSLIYVSGPSAMVDEIGDSLLRNYALPKAQLKRDWFTGHLEA
ncbi:MAG: ferredoxin--NADP reductase [Candidatus Saccharimonadales bacterium]